jgi:hypothetical protein
LGVYDSATRQMTPRIRTIDSMMTSLGWLKHKNTNGANIYVRPRGSIGLLLADDVTPAALTQLSVDGLDLAAVVLTSTDNDQAWVQVSASPIAEDPAPRLRGSWPDATAVTWPRPSGASTGG